MRDDRNFWSIALAVLACLVALAIFGIFVGLYDNKAEPPKPGPTVTRTFTLTPAPAPTVTVTAKPKPAPTVTVTKVREVSRSTPRKQTTRPSVEAFLICVVRHESSGDPKAQNPTSSASGLFQFIDSSWRAYAKAAGVTGYRRAKDAPASVQWQVARHTVINFGHYPWKGTSCGYGT